MFEINDEDEDKICSRCEGAGWECYGIGQHDPHFKICEDCYNPLDRKSP
jgi:hypothetical protein